MNKCAVIKSGGTLEEAFIIEQLDQHKDRFLIGVDKGAAFLYSHHIQPDYIVGDFDSLPSEIERYYKEETAVPMKEFNPMKDNSDTEIAVLLAMERGCREIYLYGATGTRLDHVVANIQTLSLPHRAGIHAEILDGCNRIRLIEKEEIIYKNEMFGKYFSVFPLEGCVEHFNIEGAEYPLEDYTLTPYNSRCVSNQAKEDKVRITFPKGIVILMETRDNVI